MNTHLPCFKKIELSDKKLIERVGKRFAHYSDFSFTNIWSWDSTGDKGRIAEHNGNILVRYKDHESKKSFSFFGEGDPNKTASILLKTCLLERVPRVLKRVPEEIALVLDDKKFKITEDRDNFDYIYKTEELATYSGGTFARKRNEVNAFLKNYPTVVAKKIDLKDICTRKEVTYLFHEWVRAKIAKGDAYESSEELAFNNLLLLADTQEFVSIGLYIEKRLVAFFIGEILTKDYAVGHFAKADASIKGTTALLLQSLAKELQASGVTYFNYEQDLGIENLREAKTRFRPSHFLKKYQVRLR